MQARTWPAAPGPLPASGGGEAAQMTRRSLRRRGLRRRVAGRGAVLAHLVTFTNLACGFAALLFAVEGYPRLAVSLIFLCTVLDFCDGALARMAGHGSAFGKELD